MNAYTLAKTNNTKSLTELFKGLEGYDDDEQRKNVIEMNRMIEEMVRIELYYAFTIEQFDKISEMIDERKDSISYALFTLKCIGYFKELENTWDQSFDGHSLEEKYEKMIIGENLKKKWKNENLLISLCECYIVLTGGFNSDILLICVPCLLKVALRKEEDEETQKEVEMALLALSNIGTHYPIDQELYLNELKEIIKHHQEHHNLTRFAYQSAWKFLMYRLDNGRSLEDMITKELHFTREETKELEELLQW
ncbi:uncharacterized protein MONOS_18658 [Monocercomonoides exilis]|uniref:uncharacterized protein n=1 Tax=Monocercomonoides exilis TaxID=2049356 RepID=UPI0035594A88|nr:hypothetical protein MONOS_18658 [Monocercomonoides exilis]